MVAYNFFILALIFLIPGSIIYGLRRDLRPVIHLMALCALPFALTESLFYLSYWEPEFLFDLGRRIGFGIEDFLFVIGLAAFSSTAYAMVFGMRYVPLAVRSCPELVKRILAVLGLTFLLVLLLALLQVPMIYGSWCIMILLSAGMCRVRPDLWRPALWGGGISLLIYSLLCWLIALLLPGIFELAWHTDKFLNLWVLGLPLEELMYGFASGVAATVFYPYISATGFKSCTLSPVSSNK